MKTMQFTMSLPLSPEQQSDCPAEFRKFFWALWNVPYVCIQDPMHLVVKCFRALMLKCLKFGRDVASRAVLVSFVQQVGKVISGITLAQLSQNYDRMNYSIAAKLCSKKIIGELKREGERATKEYLVFMHHIQVAYISETSSPAERIYSSWYSAFYVRMWSRFLSQVISKQEHSKDSFDLSKQKNFVSSNVEICTELNGHSLLKFHNTVRDNNRPDLFVPTLMNSQGSEETFRSIRSLSSTRSTVVNVDVLEFIQRSSRLIIMEDAPTSLGNFRTRSSKTAKTMIPTALLSDSEVAAVVHQGFDDVRKTMLSFRKFILLHKTRFFIVHYFRLGLDCETPTENNALTSSAMVFAR